MIVQSAEVRFDMERRAEQERRAYVEFRRRLLRRCPDFDLYAATVQKLKPYILRGEVGVPGKGLAIAGFDLCDYFEALYLVAKFASFGKNSEDPFFGAERPRPGRPAGGSAA